MFRVFMVIISLPLALGLPDVYGLPAREFQPEVGQAAKEHKLFLVTQDHERDDAVTSSPIEQVEIPSTSSPLQYGLPPNGQSLNSYSQGAYAGQDSDKALHHNEDGRNFDYLRSPQDIPNEELILSYKPQIASKYAKNEDSGLEYASYAPYHQADYVAGVTKVPIHRNQIYQNGQFEGPQYQRTSIIPEYNSNLYQPSRAQATLSREDRTYGIPTTESYRDSKYELPVYKPLEVYNQDQTRKYDSPGYQRYETPKSGDYQTHAEQVDNYYGRHDMRGHYHGVVSHQSPVVPVRYIAVFQRHQAPGKADISTASYLTQPVSYQQQALVLPTSFNYRNNYYPPIGSISSTFISKDAYQRQPAYSQPIYRNAAQQEVPAVSAVSSPLQSTYGLPNF